MVKTVKGKHGVCIDFLIPDDASDGDKLSLINKLQEIADILESVEQFEQVVERLGYEAEKEQIH